MTLQLSQEKCRVYETSKPEVRASGLGNVPGRNEEGKDILILTGTPNLINGVSVSNDRFIKFIPSEEAMWLLINRGHAFRLLTIIAESVRRYDGAPDGLKIGECFIGGHENYGMSEQNYRTAKDILVMRQHLKIVETSRTRKKSTNGSTTVGTKVRLLSSNVWDVNLIVDNERSNEWVTNDQRMTNDKLRKNKKEKKEKKEEEESSLTRAKEESASPPPPPSECYQEKFEGKIHVSENNMKRLLEKFGGNQSLIDSYADRLYRYSVNSPSKFKKYKRHDMVIEDWIEKDLTKSRSEKKPEASQLTESQAKNWALNRELIDELKAYHPEKTSGISVYYKTHSLRDNTRDKFGNTFDISCLIDHRAFCEQLEKRLRIHIVKEKFPNG